MKYYLFNHAKGRQYYVFFGDVLVLLLGVIVSYGLRIFINNDWSLSFELLRAKLTPWLILVIGPQLFSLYLLGQYNLNRLISRFRSAVLLILSVLLAGVMIGTLFFFFPRYIFGRQVFLINLIVSSCFLIFWRFVINEILDKRVSIRRMAVIGDEDIISRYIKEVKELAGKSIEIVAAYYTNQVSEKKNSEGLTIYDDMQELLKSEEYEILVYDPLCKAFGRDEVQRIIEKKYQGKIVFDIPSLYKNLTGKIPIQYINGAWLLQQEGLQGYVSKPYIHMKRLLDIVLATILTALLLPLGLLIALAVKFDSRGPVIFAQTRLGKHKKPFKCYKFRTMINDAEKKCGPVWSSHNDPRITRVGRILRKTRFDELPQILNILKGDLSFVGPRPIRKHFAEQLQEKIPFYDIRFSVQPGLSGWAQVKHDYAGSEDGQIEKFKYELFYILNMSFFLDFLTIIMTIKSVLQGEGK